MTFIDRLVIIAVMSAGFPGRHVILRGCAALAALPLLAHAAIQVAQAPDLAELSLEQLTNVTVTSASRRPERLTEAPASIFVITGNEIRRSGATTLQEALRLAPNLHVAAIDNSQYGVSARGFNSTTANKLLVMIDGRTVYTPLFSGVFWDAQEVMLEDVERIEVISGPAATLWGANGVNGVISITTRSSAQTHGTLATGYAGNQERGGAIRHGGAFGDSGHYRVYARYLEIDANRVATGTSSRDEAERKQVGFRADWKNAGGDVFTVQGDAYRGEGDNITAPRSFSGSNLIGRWESKGEGGASSRLQAYVDRTDRDHAGTFGETLDIFDVEYQRTSHPLTAHTLVWGAGYRRADDRVRNSAGLAFLPAERTLRWGNVFAQDELALTANLQLTVGVKLETNPYTGHEWLPNARLAWQLSPDHLVWGAVSRAVRAPSRLDRELFLPARAPFVVLAGNDTFESEVANVAEIGYRAQHSTAASYSLTAFAHRFPNLRSVEPSAAGPILGNGIEGRVHGVEGWGTWRLNPHLRLDAGFVAMGHTFKVRPGIVDLRGFSALGNDPKRTAIARATWDPTPRHEVNFTVRHVGALPDPAVPSYTTLDARLGWHVSKSLEISLTVRNAANRNYAQFGTLAARAERERAYLVRATWGFL